MQNQKFALMKNLSEIKELRKKEKHTLPIVIESKAIGTKKISELEKGDLFRWSDAKTSDKLFYRHKMFIFSHFEDKGSSQIVLKVESSAVEPCTCIGGYHMNCAGYEDVFVKGKVFGESDGNRIPLDDREVLIY